MTAIALILWPFVSLLYFRFLTVPAAIAATVVGGYLLLPGRGGFDLPLLPAIDKNSVASVSALALATVFAKRATGALSGWLPRSPIILGLIGLLIVGAFGTAYTNADEVRVAATVLPGLRLYDALSIIMNTMVGLIPFLLARKFFATSESHRTLLVVLVVAGSCYSFLALYEIRMSPQLNRMLYGYFPHSWLQHLRGNGFRPVVFLNHALWLAIFLSCCSIAAFSLWRIDSSKWRIGYLVAGLLLLVTLVLAKNFGAILITFMLLPVVLLLPFRMQILVAGALATTLTLYPVLRAGGLVPTETVVETLAEINAARVGNLEFRLKHEDSLLAKAKERPVFGWGGYGRGRVYDENGRDISVTDGEWIIIFANGGWVGYVGRLGILTFAVFVMAVRWRRYELDPATAALSVVLAANLIDLIPNATATSVTLLIAGAMAGRLEMLSQSLGIKKAELDPANHRAGMAAPVHSATRVQTKAPSTSQAPTEIAGPVFSRFAPKPGRNG